MSRVVDLRSVIRHRVLHASVCDAAFTFGTGNAIWSCWPQRREAGRVPDIAPFSPSLCPLFKRPAQTQTQCTSLRPVYCRIVFQIAISYMFEKENAHTKQNVHLLHLHNNYYRTRKTRISKHAHKQTLQDLTNFNHYGFIRCRCTKKLKVDTMSLFNISVAFMLTFIWALTHICSESAAALTWPLHSHLSRFPLVSLSLPLDNWKQRSPFPFVCIRLRLWVQFNIESDVSKFTNRKRPVFSSETCAHLPFRSEPGNVQANCEPYWVQRCVFLERGSSSWHRFKRNQQKALFSYCSCRGLFKLR